MACSFLVPLQTTFTSLDMQDDGLVLTSCGCHGSSRVYLPRTHIDYVHSGRLFHVGMFVLGLVLMIVGIVYLKHSDSHYADNQKMVKILIGVGVAVMILAILLTIPSSLLISANNGIFVSANCCGCGGRDRLDEISKFVATGAMSTDVNIGINLQSVQLNHVHPYPNVPQQSQTSVATPPTYGPRPHRQ